MERYQRLCDLFQADSQDRSSSFFFHRYMSGQETNQNQIEDINKKNGNLENTAHPHPDTSNDTLRDSPLLDLQTPDPYTHQKSTPPTTPCVTIARSWICEPWPLHTPHDTSNHSLCDSPPRNESTKSANPHPQLEVRTPIAKAIWGNINLWKTSTSKIGPASADVAFRSWSLVDRYPQGNGRGIQRSKGWFVCNSMDQAPDISKVTTLVCHAYDAYMIFSMKVWCN